MTLVQLKVLLLILAVLYPAYILGICIYRLWFHPLSKYPGPILAKLSNLYSAYYAWTGDLHIDMLRCHEKYGDYVRYAPNRLLINSSTGMKLIYGNSKDFQKSSAYHVMVHRAPSTFTATDKKLHSQKRRLLSHGFSTSALQEHNETIMAHVGKLANQLAPDSPNSSEWSVVHNMSKWASYLAADVVFDVIFGENHNLIDNHESRYIIQCIEDCNIRTGVLFQAREIGRGRIDRYLFSHSIVSRNKFIPFISSLLKRRMAASPIQRNDVFSLLLDSKNSESGNGPSMAELGGESTTLLMAGTETTSTSIASTFFYLLKNPEVYAKVSEEIRQNFPRYEEVCLGAKLNSCTYLRACIDESLRMSPPAASAQWREVISDGVLVDGKPVPAGCDVGTSLYAIHHHSAYFSDPFVFRPERWLLTNNAENAEEIQLAQGAFAPFSVGPRSCVAKGLAISEAMLTLAALLTKFDIKIAEGPEGDIGGGTVGNLYGRHRTDEYQLRDHVAAARDGPFVQFRERKS